jgi:D-3-phosphoglycerate dehydrogenase / 2-oxoglutarate reductase
MPKAVISDHSFLSIELQSEVLERAGFVLEAISPICRTEDDVIRTCGDADVLLVQWAPITRRVMEALPKLRGIVRYGVGVNNLDLDAARDLGITIANVPNFCLEEVSDHTLSFLLALGRRIPQDHHNIARGGWGINDLLPIPSFRDLTLGLVGFGAIAQLVAKKASVFGFHIIASDPHQKESVFHEYGVERSDFETLLQSADIISLHTPLVPETQHLINRESIEKMQKGVILINTSRGPVVKERDLIEALQRGHVLAAGLDVFEEEPLPLNSPLRSMPQVILTSHAASVSTRAVRLLQIKAAEAAREILLSARPESALVLGNPEAQKERAR